MAKAGPKGMRFRRAWRWRTSKVVKLFAVAVLVFLTQLALALYFLSRPYGERALIPVPKPSGEATLQEGVTIFTVPNFIRLDDETWLRQELAVRSWKSLDPPAKAIVLIDDGATEGAVADLARTCGVGYLRLPPDGYTPSGIPSMRSIFRLADTAGNTTRAAFVNTDIVLPRDFVGKAERAMGDGIGEPVTASGLRVDCTWARDGDSETKEDIARSLAMVLEAGRQDSSPDYVQLSIRDASCQPHKDSGKDYFIWPRGFWDPVYQQRALGLGSPWEFPDFGIGKTHWDHYTLGVLGMTSNLVDLSPVVHAVHIKHVYDSDKMKTRCRKFTCAINDMATPATKRNKRLFKKAKSEIGIRRYHLSDAPNYRACPTPGGPVRSLAASPNANWEFRPDGPSWPWYFRLVSGYAGLTAEGGTEWAASKYHELFCGKHR